MHTYVPAALENNIRNVLYDINGTASHMYWTLCSIKQCKKSNTLATRHLMGISQCASPPPKPQWDFQEYHRGEILASNRVLISFKGVAMDVTMAIDLDVAMNMAMTIGHDATSHTAARLIIYPWIHGYYHGHRCVRHGRQHGHNHANDRDLVRTVRFTGAISTKGAAVDIKLATGKDVAMNIAMTIACGAIPHMATRLLAIPLTTQLLTLWTQPWIRSCAKP